MASDLDLDPMYWLRKRQKYMEQPEELRAYTALNIAMTLHPDWVIILHQQIGKIVDQDEAERTGKI